jgi:hypothetical protein
MADVLYNLIAFKILTMLVTPFKETDAYKLGIIDENGKNLIKPSKFTKYAQKEAYSYLHRLVFNMKRILMKLPGGDNRIKNIAAALYLIKEYHQAKEKSFDLMEDRLNSILNSNAVLVEEILEAENFFEQKEVEEEAPTNATGAAVSTDRTVVRKKDVDKYKLQNVGALKFVKRKPNVAN